VAGRAEPHVVSGTRYATTPEIIPIKIVPSRNARQNRRAVPRFPAQTFLHGKTFAASIDPTNGAQI
jgi:hypothetical protein